MIGASIWTLHFLQPTPVAIQNTTKFTPFYILFGRNPHFPLEAEKMAESVSVERAMKTMTRLT